ncbi:bifunctional folylpolyglutamate synthase/dihydrofolate synthase [Candidatus Acetothermia bacterium]|nr:bifunctional folylpolyglutamate synthase/dihydrofolate synthase [Candidatus Acetothermia bacterium]
MTRERMLEKLYNLKGTGLDLRKVLMRMSNPQEKFRSIRVGGTNGKGSTCVFLAQILRESGYRIGLFTSPHLSDPEERIEINGEKISREGFQIFFERSWHVIREIYGPQAESKARFFEVLVAMALDYFAEHRVEIAIIEAGVGGRRDDTNVVCPILSILTSVDLDHCEVLGNTLQEIAHEKAGLAPPGITLLTAEEKPEALGVIEAVCRTQRSELIHVDFSRLRVKRSDWDGQCFDWGSLENLETRVLGRYQLRNAAMALTAIELLNKKSFAVSEHAIREGLRKACWPGRMELLHKRPYVLLDGAKNPAGLRSLKNSLCGLEYENLILVLGIATRKDIFQMVQEIIPGAAHAIITQAPFRGSEPELLAAEVQRITDAYEIVPTPALALERALTLAQSDDLVCVTGSLFLMGEVRSLWHNP